MRKLKNSELNRISVADFKTVKKMPVTIILDNIRSLANVGSVFRTSDAFLIKEIILCGITATPPHREIQKTALGATESVDWRYVESTAEVVKELQANKVRVYAVEQADESKMLDVIAIDFDQEIAIVMGNEVKGVSDEVMEIVDDCIELPQFGTKHSLNISVTTGIMIWELFQQYQRQL
ncbi:MAG: TrmH family RNA methyltransferase [Bacteroidetes bacterium]|nr:MAG: TrmH family RNA methyltransferase [Bacteroidota bacterium]